MFSFCRPAPDLKCRSEGLIVLVNGVGGCGKSSFCYHTRVQYPIVMTLSHDDHQLPNGEKLDGLSTAELHSKLWSKAREYGQYGRMVLVEFNEPHLQRVSSALRDSSSPYCVVLVYCKLQDLPKRLQDSSTSHQDLCRNIFKALQDFGVYFTGDPQKYPTALQYIKRSHVESTIDHCFKLMRTNTVRDMDMKTALDIVKEFVLKALHLGAEDGQSAVYVYARQPYDVVLNSSANSTDGLVKKLVPAITPVRAKGFLSTLRMLPSGEEKEVPYVCEQCGGTDFQVRRLPCSACFGELASRLLQYDSQHSPKQHRPHMYHE